MVPYLSLVNVFKLKFLRYNLVMTHLNSTLQNLRVSYQLHSLDINDCDKNPINQFNKWFEDAHEG